MRCQVFFVAFLLWFSFAAGSPGLLNGLTNNVNLDLNKAVPLDLNNVEKLDLNKLETLDLIDVVTQIEKFALDKIANFNGFMDKFNKTYENEDQKNKALLSFLLNQDDIEYHNQLYDSGAVSFTRGVWENSDMLPVDVNRQMNGFHRPVQARVAMTGDSSFIPPQSLNWVTEGFVTPIQNQGLCGSCWSFSSTGALEGQIFKKTGKIEKFSEQNLIDCNRNDVDGNYGCGGGDMGKAFEFLIAQKGIALESKYPYEVKDTLPCRYEASQSAGTVLSYEAFEGGDEELLKKVLAENGPVSIAIDASLASFQSYMSGVYFDPECTRNINHAVLLVGYGKDEKTSKDYWLVKNTYGLTWGEEGYVRLARGENNHCGIAEFAVMPKF